MGRMLPTESAKCPVSGRVLPFGANGRAVSFDREPLGAVACSAVVLLDIDESRLTALPAIRDGACTLLPSVIAFVCVSVLPALAWTAVLLLFMFEKDERPAAAVRLELLLVSERCLLMAMKSVGPVETCGGLAWSLAEAMSFWAFRLVATLLAVTCGFCILLFFAEVPGESDCLVPTGCQLTGFCFFLFLQLV